MHNPRRGGAWNRDAVARSGIRWDPEQGSSIVGTNPRSAYSEAASGRFIRLEAEMAAADPGVRGPRRPTAVGEAERPASPAQPKVYSGADSAGSRACWPPCDRDLAPRRWSRTGVKFASGVRQSVHQFVQSAWVSVSRRLSLAHSPRGNWGSQR